MAPCGLPQWPHGSPATAGHQGPFGAGAQAIDAGAAAPTSDDLLAQVRDLAHWLVAVRRHAQRELRLLAFPQRILEAVEHLAQALAPRVADHLEVRVALVDAHHA